MSSPEQFPRDQLESRLRAVLAEMADDDATLNGQSVGIDAGGLPDGVEVDSMTAAVTLGELESHLEIKIPVSIVRPGGYSTVDDAVRSLLEEAERVWADHRERATA